MSQKSAESFKPSVEEIEKSEMMGTGDDPEINLDGYVKRAPEFLESLKESENYAAVKALLGNSESADEWTEADHPRVKSGAEGGQFTSGGQGGGSSTTESKKKESKSTHWNATEHGTISEEFDDQVEISKWEYEPSPDPVIAHRQKKAKQIGADIIDYYMDHDKGEIYVMKKDKEVLGGVYVLGMRKIDNDICHVVDELTVHPKVIGGQIQAKGIGTGLMLKAAASAARWKHGLVLTSMDSESDKFYEKIGMRKLETDKLGQSVYNWTSEECKVIADYGSKGAQA